MDPDYKMLALLSEIRPLEYDVLGQSQEVA